MTESSQEALGQVLESLRSRNARGIADDISRVIARGITEEIDIKGKIKELSQRPLDADEAYNVAVEMLIAFLEPIIMKKHVMDEINKTMGLEASIVWRQDYVEKSPIAPEFYEKISLPELEDVEKLEEELKNIIILMGEV